MQIEFAFQKPEVKILQANTIGYGKPFKYVGNSGIFIRVKPVNYILNSGLVTDKLNRGDVLIVNLEKGTCFFTKGTEHVFPIDATVNVK